MSQAVFPTLPGLTWNVVKRPQHSTTVQRSVGGRETRYAFYSSPIWRWTLTYEVLRQAAALLELQQLVGFFNARQGMFDSFLYSDPTDNAVVDQAFGTGDGVATGFQLVRDYGAGGFLGRENVYDLNGTPVLSKTDAFIGKQLLYATPRTNSARWSRDLTNGAWTATGGGTAALNAVGVDGTANSATTLTDPSAATVPQWTQTFTIPADTSSHAISFWVKKDTDQTRFPEFIAQISGGTGVTRKWQLNTQTGVAASESTSGVGSTRVVSNGLWWVIELVVANNGTAGNTTLTVAVNPAGGSTLGVFSGAATGSVVIGQVQVELNQPSYTPPILTTTAAVTITDYAINGAALVTFALAPAAAAALTWTGAYYWRVRFDVDEQDFTNFLAQLWETRSLAFVTVK